MILRFIVGGVFAFYFNMVLLLCFFSFFELNEPEKGKLYLFIYTGSLSYFLCYKVKENFASWWYVIFLIFIPFIVMSAIFFIGADFSS